LIICELPISKIPFSGRKKGYFVVILPLERQQITSRQRKILTVAKTRKEFAVSEIKKLMREKVTDRTIKSDVKGLVDIGLLARKGNGKRTRYTIYV
jgi:Fic family protein